MTRFPDFYLVGAPKCGTSAMYNFLKQHPELFLPDTKELLLFAKDLSYPTRLSQAEFCAHYPADRCHAKCIGTAHTAYMQSRTAAAEIKQVRPDAYILIMIRNPIDVVASWHSELLYQTIEDIEDLGTALNAESDRRRGKRIPRGARNSYIESLYYTDVVAFSEQIERYRAEFGESHVRVIVHDDFEEDPYLAYRDTLRFLRVDESFSPYLAKVNPNKVVRSRTLQTLYFRTASPAHAAVKRLIPRPVRRQLLTLNVREQPRDPLSPAIRQRLERQLGPEIARLSELLDRDLSSWMGRGGVRRAGLRAMSEDRY